MNDNPPGPGAKLVVREHLVALKRSFFASLIPYLSIAFVVHGLPDAVTPALALGQAPRPQHFQNLRVAVTYLCPALVVPSREIIKVIR